MGDKKKQPASPHEQWHAPMAAPEERMLAGAHDAGNNNGYPAWYMPGMDGRLFPNDTVVGYQPKVYDIVIDEIAGDETHTHHVNGNKIDADALTRNIKRAFDTMHKQIKGAGSNGNGFSPELGDFHLGFESNDKPVFDVGRKYIASRVQTLGSLSEHEESGGRGPGTVSTGFIGKKGSKVPDPGGVSYGTYQFTSRTRQSNKSYKVGGTVQHFINSLEAQKWKARFAGLTPGSEEFSVVWQEMANSDHDSFKEAQHSFIERTHYLRNSANLQKDLGLDIDKRSTVLRDVVWSTSVQHGGENSVIQNALKNKDINKLTDEEIIKLIYAERGAKKGGALKYFSGATSESSKTVLLNRFTRESKEALKRLKHE